MRTSHGQGTESCGGYDVGYDPYEDGLTTGIWTMKDQTQISIHKMSKNHLIRAIRLCRYNSYSGTFSCESDKWDAWVELFQNEIDSRKCTDTKRTVKDARLPLRGTKITMICHCGNEYKARSSDIKRGWD